MTNSTYRPDIEGLRAIAVITVVLFHAGYSAFPAGFIGVDIFFVISGFLITSGIYKGIQQDNFSIISFFNRRFWRIQPLLLTLVVATVLFEYWRMTPADLIKFANSLKSLGLFTSNQYFASLEFGYFADDTSIMPLLHTWSLSIEWQWYFLLPFLLVLLANDLGKKTLPWILLIGFVVMAYFGIKDSSHDDNIRYYSFTMRCFALMAGASIATIDTKRISERLPLPLSNVLSFVFLGLLIYIGTTEKTIPQYPNFFCLGVVLLTAFLIILGSSERKNVTFKILSFKPFVFLGMISYSLYIWHWPIFAFARYTQIQVTGGEFAMLIAVSIIVAALSYKFIENPLRKLHRKVPLVATLIILVLVPAIFTYHFDRRAVKYDGYPDRNPSYAIQVEYSAKTRRALLVKGIGNKTAKPSVLLMGDSWVEHFLEMTDQMLLDANLTGYSVRGGNDLPFVDTDQNNPGAKTPDLARRDRQDKLFVDIANKKYKFVVFGNNMATYLAWHHYGKHPDILVPRDKFDGTHKEYFIYSLNKTVDLVVKSGATPVFIKGIYDRRDPNYSPRGTLVDYSRCGITVFGEQCSFEDNSDETEMNEIYKKIQEKYPQTIIIDVHEFVCQNGTCSTILDDYPLYLDRGGHITPYASHRLGEMYLEKYGNPFKK